MIADYERARDFAVRYLSHGPRSRKQLRDRLVANGFSDTAVDAVVQLLEEKRYIDDVGFAKNYISHKTRINNYGKRRIVIDLLQKGVPKEDIQAAYQQADEDNDTESELDAAARALAKRIARKDPASIKKDPKEMQRLMAFLIRRGFSYEVAKEAIKNWMMSNKEELS